MMGRRPFLPGAWLAIVLSLAWTAGCESTATEIMLVVRTDLAVPPTASPELDAVAITLSREPGAARERVVDVPLDGNTRWPATLLLTPASAANTAYVRVSGTLGPASVVEQSAHVSFDPGNTRMLVIDLLRSCAGVVCDAGETCRDGACGSEDRREASLPPWNGKAPSNLGPNGPEREPCTGPWTDVVEISVTENNDYDDDPSFTADLLEFYFASNRGGSEQLWVSKRASSEAPWGEPTRVEGIMDGVNIETPQGSRDGLRLWFAARVNGGEKDLFVSERAQREDPWPAAVPVPIWDDPNEIWDDRDVGEFDEGRGIIFSSSYRSMGPGGDYDLFVAMRTGGVTEWSTPVRLSQVSLQGESDMGPFPTPDGARLYFHRQHGSSGDADLYVSEHVPLSGEYGAPLPIAELNAFKVNGVTVSSYVQDISVSDDECFAMFARQFDDPDQNGLNVSNVYVASRSE